MSSQIGRLKDRLEARMASMGGDVRDDLSPLAGRLLNLLVARGALLVSAAAEGLDANRNTLKDKFGELVKQGYAELKGKGRGAHYRPVRKLD